MELPPEDLVETSSPDPGMDPGGPDVPVTDAVEDPGPTDVGGDAADLPPDPAAPDLPDPGPLEDTFVAPEPGPAVEKAIEAGWKPMQAVPSLDGRCEEYASLPVMPLGTATGEGSRRAWLSHDTRRAFLCVSGAAVPAGGVLVVRASLDASRGAGFGDSDLELRVDPAGPSYAVNRLVAGGAPVPLPFGEDDLRSAVHGDDLELAFGTSLLGGYDRVGGLWIAILDAAGSLVEQWPRSAEAAHPDSWGDLVLGPSLPEDADAGSVRVDGDGYVVLPRVPELDGATELTVMAWVKRADGACGTLVGGGYLRSFWLGLCDRVGFGFAGPQTVAWGRTRLDAEWHHVAATFSADGRQFVYVDGEVDFAGGIPRVPADAPRFPPTLGVPAGLVRVGSDPEAPAGLDRLNAWVNDVRIYPAALAAADVQAAAFAPPPSPQPGVRGAVQPAVAFGLKRSLAGVAPASQSPERKAGRVGMATLARMANPVTAFKARVPPAGTLPPVVSSPTPSSWSGHVPLRYDDPPVIDGQFSPREWSSGAWVRMDPGGTKVLRVAMSSQTHDLYVGIPLLFGGPTADDGVSIYLSNPLAKVEGTRIDVTPRGTVTVSRWDGDAFQPLAAQVDAAFASGDRLKPLKDLVEIPSPWWRAEVRIPAALWKVDEVTELARMAFEVRSSVFASDGQTVSSQVLRAPAETGPYEATWSPLVLDAPVGTARPDMPPLLPLVKACDDRTHPLDAYYPPPTAGPDEDRFDDNLCFGGASVAEAAWDCMGAAALFTWQSCLLMFAMYAEDPVIKWPAVEMQPDGNPRMAYAEGIVTSVATSKDSHQGPVDSPDVEMTLYVGEPYGHLNFTEDPDQNTVLAALESNSFFYRNRPGQFDHVTVVGPWVMNCGGRHFTEIRPALYLESDRLEARRTGNGLVQQVRTVKVHRNGYTGATGAWNLTQPFVFKVDIPEGPGQPFLRVSHLPLALKDVDLRAHIGAEVCYGSTCKATGQCAAAWEDRSHDDMIITILPPPGSTQGGYDLELVVGRTTLPALEPAPPAWDLKFDVLYLDVFNEDPDRNTPWWGDVNVNGFWSQLLPWTEVVYAGGTLQIDEWNARFRILANRDPGVYVNLVRADEGADYGYWDRWSLTPLCPPDATCPPDGTLIREQTDWALSYHWTPVSAETLAASDVADDPGEPVGNALATVPMPEIGVLDGPGGATDLQQRDVAGLAPGATISSDHEGFLAQAAVAGLADFADYWFFEPDVDDFPFEFNDFSVVTPSLSKGQRSVGTMTASWVPWHTAPLACDGPGCSICPYVPVELVPTVGAKQGVVRVQGPAGTAGGEYRAHAVVGRREVPRDPDESLFTETGHLLDIAGADAVSTTLLSWQSAPCPGSALGGRCAEVAAPDAPVVRKAQAAGPWAWQQVPGETHRYTLRIPRPRTPPNAAADLALWCTPDGPLRKAYDPGRLQIKAPGLRLKVHFPAAASTLDSSNDGGVLVEDLARWLPTRDVLAGDDQTAEILVEVTSRDGVAERCVYRLEIDWVDSWYVTAAELGDLGSACGSAAGGGGLGCGSCTELPLLQDSQPSWWWSRGPGQVDPAPFRGSVTFQGGDTFVQVQTDQDGPVAVVVSAEPGRTLAAELLAGDGVQLAGGEGIAAASQEASGAGAGLVEAVRVSSEASLPRGTYLLRITDRSKAPGATATQGVIGLSTGY